MLVYLRVTLAWHITWSNFAWPYFPLVSFEFAHKCLLEGTTPMEKWMLGTTISHPHWPWPSMVDLHHWDADGSHRDPCWWVSVNRGPKRLQIAAGAAFQVAKVSSADSLVPGFFFRVFEAARHILSPSFKMIQVLISGTHVQHAIYTYVYIYIHMLRHENTHIILPQIAT